MIWVIFGMFIVTYIPRMLPMVLTKDIAFPPLLERWLQYIPYAALGALIFPGVLEVDTEHKWIGLIGAVVAFGCAWMWKSIFVPLFTAVLTVFLLQTFIV
ncbi:AzlD domain-containing protein [Caldalkalibacillus salinus]|uniref:AzlD domain-containing protein n=1 Tax=Caldalkalibacillus salinus TaxID=2803787 RepID=UPI001924D4F7|nr:AzlD domain-containing protein [Caldalkalibacillus salinus]